ncbi:hypothetical protein [Streptomyces sp. NPDC048200]
MVSTWALPPVTVAHDGCPPDTSRRGSGRFSKEDRGGDWQLPACTDAQAA